MEEYVSDINYDNIGKLYKKKQAECIDETFPNEMKEGVNDRNENKNENYDKEKNKGEITDYESTKIDESTCSGDRFYDIFDKEEEIIT